MMIKEEYQKTLIRMWDSIRQDGAYKGRPNCYSVKCKMCPLKPVCDQKNHYTNVFEAIKIVEKWAEEHPITNREILIEIVREKFGDKIDLDALTSILNKQGCNLINGKCRGGCNTCDQHNFWDKEYQEAFKDADKN